MTKIDPTTAIIYHPYEDYRAVSVAAATEVGFTPLVVSDLPAAFEALQPAVGVLIAPYDEPKVAQFAAEATAAVQAESHLVRLRRLAGFMGVPWVLIATPGTVASSRQLLQEGATGSNVVVPPYNMPDSPNELLASAGRLDERARLLTQHAIRGWLLRLPVR